MLAEPGSIAARYSNGRDFNMAESLVIELAKDSIAKIVRSSFDALTQDEALTRNVQIGSLSCGGEWDGNEYAVEVILENCPHNNDAKPEGLSPVVAAIMKRNREMLRMILQKKPTWIHLMDTYNRLPLHYASIIGFLQGVDLLLDKCKCCTIQRDKYGNFPIHLASQGGHVDVVKKLLEYCPDLTEMLDTIYERNILHIAWKT
ncbi:hypothetical protein TSUD_249570 [Trifolium subterraneum]|nr:hypothetical protein TSUD_249570 [Trifolium subterraneum]